MKSDYAAPEGFINDESFIEWANNTNETSVNYWEDWIRNNPDKKEVAYYARTICQSVFVIENIPQLQLANAEENLLRRIRNKNKPAKVYKLYSKKWLSVAAAVLLIAIAGGVWQHFSHTSLKTDFAQTVQKNLPDGSEVILNANSSISYNKWNESNDREVWIKGEAFFHVKKTPDHRRFIVHANHFDVIVTGTQFNVVNRNDKTNVMLTEGSVTIRKENGEKIKMKPGDFIELNNNQFVKKAEKSENVLAWKDHKLYFDNVSMTEAAKMIEDQYGVSVKIADDGTASKSISGILPNTSLDLLLSSLEATSDFKIVRNNNEIIIEKP